MKSEQLLTQGKIFEDDILAGPECTNNPAEDVPEPYDHAKNLIGTLPIELGAKSLILRVYDVLINDKGKEQAEQVQSRVCLWKCVTDRHKASLTMHGQDWAPRVADHGGRNRFRHMCG